MLRGGGRTVRWSARLVVALGLIGANPAVIRADRGGAPTEACAPTTPVVGDWPCSSPPTEPLTCPPEGRAAVADKAAQRFWLCSDGRPVSRRLPMTTGGIGYGLPPVGTYDVIAKHEHWSGLNGEPLQHFVAFYRTPRGNQIAFHDAVHQEPSTVGDLDQRGASAGCFRLRPPDALTVWDHLQVGDRVVVITP